MSPRNFQMHRTLHKPQLTCEKPPFASNKGYLPRRSTALPPSRHECCKGFYRNRPTWIIMTINNWTENLTVEKRKQNQTMILGF